MGVVGRNEDGSGEDAEVLHRIAGAIQNGLYGHGGIDPGTAACYSAAAAVVADLGLCGHRGSYRCEGNGEVYVGARCRSGHVHAPLVILTGRFDLDVPGGSK